MTTPPTYDGVASWNELCPDGAVRFYEGDDPEGFAAAMRELYGIDVGAEPPGGPGPGLRWLGWDTHIGGEPVRQFFIPAGLVGEIYGTDRWALGS